MAIQQFNLLRSLRISQVVSHRANHLGSPVQVQAESHRCNRAKYHRVYPHISHRITLLDSLFQLRRHYLHYTLRFNLQLFLPRNHQDSLLGGRLVNHPPSQRVNRSVNRAVNQLVNL